MLDEEKQLDVRSELTSSLVSGKPGAREKWFKNHRRVSTIKEEQENEQVVEEDEDDEDDEEEEEEDEEVDDEEETFFYSIPKRNNNSPGAEDDLLDDSAVVNMMSVPNVASSNNECQIQQPDPSDLLSLGFSLVDSITNACRLPSKYNFETSYYDIRLIGSFFSSFRVKIETNSSYASFCCWISRALAASEHSY